MTPLAVPKASFAVPESQTAPPISTAASASMAKP